MPQIKMAHIHNKCLLACQCINASRHLVEPPGIEPGSYAMLPGLLRAQFVHDLLL